MKRTVFPILMILLLVIGCGKSEKSPMRIGFNTWPGYEFIYLAEVNSLYTKAGLNVKLVQLNALGDVRRAFERGQIDVMASTMVEVLVAAENTGRKINIIAVTDESNGSDMLITRKIPDIQGLRGKKVGMEGGTVDVLVAGAALRSKGMSFKDIVVVSRTQDDLVDAIIKGHIDAIQTYPPYSVKLLNRKGFRKVFDTSQAKGEIFDTLAVDREFLQKRKTDVLNFLKVYFQSHEVYFADELKSSEIMGRREGISGEEFRAALSGMRIISGGEQGEYLSVDGFGRKALLNAAQILLEAGWLKKQPVIDDFFSPM